MGKVKLMLLSLSILAIVGAALAFTAKIGLQICTAHTVDGTCPANLYCPARKKLQAADPTEFICTAATVFGGTDLCHYANGQTVRCGSSSVNSTVE